MVNVAAAEPRSGRIASALNVALDVPAVPDR
jgi:hypothetical protein